MALDKKTQEMYDNRRSCPCCGGEVTIQMRYTKRFYVVCSSCKKEWTLPTVMEMKEQHPLEPRIKSRRQAIKDWNTLADIEAWRSKYWDSGDGSVMRDLDRDNDGTPIEEIGRYEVVFDFEGQRYYCYIDAVNIDEAMEMFWSHHSGVAEKHIADTLEV